MEEKYPLKEIVIDANVPINELLTFAVHMK